MAWFGDNFNRTSPAGPGNSTAGTPDYELDNSWDHWNAGGTRGAVIFNNGFYWYENFSFHAGAYPPITTDTDDQAIEFTLTDADNEFRIAFRAAQAMIDDGDTDLDDPDAHAAPGQITMRCQMDQGTPGQVTIMIDGSYQGPTNITGSTAYNDGQPHTFRAEIEGNELRLYIDGALKFTRNDMGTLPSGSTRRRLGLCAAGASEVQRIDNFSAGDFPLTPPPPEAPTIWVATAGHTRMGCEWTPGNTVSPVTDWEIRYATAAAPTTWLATVSMGSTNLWGAVTGVTNGTGYVMQVRGISANGNGDWSASSGTVTPTDNRGVFELQDGTIFELQDGAQFELQSGAAPATGRRPAWGLRF